MKTTYTRLLDDLEEMYCQIFTSNPIDRKHINEDMRTCYHVMLRSLVKGNAYKTVAAISFQIFSDEEKSLYVSRFGVQLGNYDSDFGKGYDNNSFQGRGLGRILLRAAQDMASSDTDGVCPKIFLQTEVCEKSFRWYKGNGFEDMGRDGFSKLPKKIQSSIGDNRTSWIFDDRSKEDDVALHMLQLNHWMTIEGCVPARQPLEEAPKTKMSTKVNCAYRKCIFNNIACTRFYGCMYCGQFVHSNCGMALSVEDEKVFANCSFMKHGTWPNNRTLPVKFAVCKTCIEDSMAPGKMCCQSDSDCENRCFDIHPLHCCGNCRKRVHCNCVGSYCIKVDELDADNKDLHPWPIVPYCKSCSDDILIETDRISHNYVENNLITAETFHEVICHGHLIPPAYEETIENIFNTSAITIRKFKEKANYEFKKKNKKYNEVTMYTFECLRPSTWLKDTPMEVFGNLVADLHRQTPENYFGTSNLMTTMAKIPKKKRGVKDPPEENKEEERLKAIGFFSGTQHRSLILDFEGFRRHTMVKTGGQKEADYKWEKQREYTKKLRKAFFKKLGIYEDSHELCYKLARGRYSHLYFFVNTSQMHYCLFYASMSDKKVIGINLYQTEEDRTGDLPPRDEFRKQQVLLYKSGEKEPRETRKSKYSKRNDTFTWHHEYLQNALEVIFNQPNQWKKEYHPTPTAPQLDESSCGVYVMLYYYCLAFHHPIDDSDDFFDFERINSQHRKSILYLIVHYLNWKPDVDEYFEKLNLETASEVKNCKEAA